MSYITDHGRITSDTIELLGEGQYSAYMHVIPSYYKGATSGMRLPVQNMINALFNKYPHLSEVGEGKPTGLFIGSGASEWAGTSRSMTESTPDFPTKIGFLGLINISGGSVAHRMKIQKYLSTDATACVSSLKCIQDAELLIASGIIEKAVILGWDYQVSSCTREVFGKLGASITKEEYENGRVPSAFRKGNGGFLIGAGIGYIVLEKECENPIAKVASISTQFFSDGNPLSVDSEGYINVMETAYNESGYSEINVLKSHGTGTCANNEAEGNAIEKVLGDRCIVTSYKPIIGHTMGASGAIELSMILDDYKRGNITGILNKEDHPQYINKDTPPSGNIFMCNAAGMGGVYTSMVGEYYER